MNDGIVVIWIILSTLLGGIFGYGIGTNENKIAITECEKPLPRTQHCTMIAVPVDRE